MKSLTARALVVGGIALVGCSDFAPVKEAGGVTAVADPTLQSNALKVLEANCASCHDHGMKAGGLGEILDVSRLLAQSLIVPNFPGDGAIMKSILGESMPPATPLDAREIAALSDWIDSFTPSARASPSPPPSSGGLKPTYQSLATNVLSRCTQCHSANGSRSQTNFESYSSLVSSGTVLPGQGLNSSLYKRTRDFSMPTEGPILSWAELAALQTWIDQGANNN